MNYEIRTASLPESEAVAIRRVIRPAELPRFFGAAFDELNQVLSASGASMFGPPFARYYSVKPEAVDVEAVMLADRPVAVTGRVKPIHLDPAEAAVVRHVGPYDAMKPAYEAIATWMSANGKHPAGLPREVYLTSPDQVPDPSKWVTLVEQPIA